MNVRMYKAPFGRVEDIEVFIDREDEAQIAAMLERHVYPAVEMLSIGHCSVTLEADDLQEDLVCQTRLCGLARSSGRFTAWSKRLVSRTTMLVMERKVSDANWINRSNL